MSKLFDCSTRRLSRMVSWRPLLCALVLALLATPALAAAAPLTGTFEGKLVGRQVTFSHGGKQRDDWAGVLKLKLDGGPTLPVFCIQIDVQVNSGDRYRSDGPVLGLVNGCQIRYLLDHYPASSAKSADEAAARQLAIWVFSDGLDPKTIGDATVRDRAIALANEAKKGACPERRTEPPNLAIEPPVASAPAGQPIAYTVRAGPADAGQPVTLAVAAPAVLLDAQKQPAGQQMQVALDGQGAAGFWVVSPSAGQVQLKAALRWRLEAGTVFNHIDSNTPTQRLVMAERQDMTASAEAQASWGGSAPPPTAPAPTATAPAPTPVPPTPTRRPSKDHPTATSTPESATEAAGTPAATIGAEQATPENATTPVGEATPAAATAPAEQATPAAVGAEQATPSAAAGTPAGPAGGRGPAGAARRPSRLPNTGDAPGPNVPLLAIVALLFIAGWLLRRVEPRGK